MVHSKNNDVDGFCQFLRERSYPGAFFNWTQTSNGTWLANVTCPDKMAFNGNKSDLRGIRTITCSSTIFNWTGLAETVTSCQPVHLCDPSQLPPYNTTVFTSYTTTWGGNGTTWVGDNATYYQADNGTSVFSCLENGTWAFSYTALNLSSTSSATIPTTATTPIVASAPTSSPLLAVTSSTADSVTSSNTPTSLTSSGAPSTGITSTTARISSTIQSSTVISTAPTTSMVLSNCSALEVR